MTDDQLSPRSGGEILVDALRLHGVEDVFCVPGESYLAALDAMYGARNQIRVITCRQEGGASFMTEAYGKMTGCSAPGSLDTSLSHAAGLIEIAACHA